MIHQRLASFIKKSWWVLAAQKVVVVLIYSFSIRGPQISDDVEILQNLHENMRAGELLGIFADAPQIAMTNLHFVIGYGLSGTSTWGYHALNILVHIANVWLVFVIFHKLSSRTVALFASSIFALHPLAGEAVHWISGGAYARYSMFFLGSFYTYLYARKSQQMKLYIGSYALFLLSLLTSEKAMSLPLVFVTYEFVTGELKKRWRHVAPYAAMSLVIVGNTALHLTTRINSIEQLGTPTGANPVFDWIKPMHALSSYLLLFVWPQSLSLYHAEGYTSERIIFAASTTALFFAGYVYSYFRHKSIFFWLSLTLIVLAPTIIPLNVSSTYAERYIYPGLVGFCFVAATGLEYMRKRQASITYVIFGFVLLALCVRGIERARDWGDSERFWINTLHTSPESFQAHNNVGAIHFKNGDFASAAYEFEQVLQTVPNDAEMHQNLALAYTRLGQLDKALRYYNSAIELDKTLWLSYWNRGGIYHAAKDYKRAIASIEQALKYRPNDARIVADLGVVHLDAGNKTKAREYFQKALQLDPANPKAQSELQKQ